MKTRVIILAGGAGTRLSVLTAKRTKPAVPFGGKYRIIDFPLSNCVNSGLFDITIIAQYRPHSLIEHIGAGAPWDLNRDFTGGVRIYTPYTATSSAWFMGTADAVQRNFGFIKQNDPEMILILSGDHVYGMDYSAMIDFHVKNKADLTMATIQVPIQEASRFGIVGIDDDLRVTSFIEKPEDPPSNQANMGIYLFNHKVLDEALWKDHTLQESTHDFGKDILPALVNSNKRVFAYPYSGYWVDVGTIPSYWQAHMDMLAAIPALNLHDRSWIIHTRTEERPPVMIHPGAAIEDSMICDGCIIEGQTKIIHSVLSPGVRIKAGSVIKDSTLLTDTLIEENVTVKRSILDKHVIVNKNCIIGDDDQELSEESITMIGKRAEIPVGTIIQPGATIGAYMLASEFSNTLIKSGENLQTRRAPHEI
jgi:glucose-1-phosphate adenylyltransferase